MRTRDLALALITAVALAVHSSSVLTQSPPPGPYFVADLGTFGGARSDAFAVNDRGEVAGGAQRADGATHGFFYDGSLHDVGTVGGGTESLALALNRRGQVVGSAVTALGNTKGFVWEAGTRRSLGTLGGAHSAALGIGENGDIVGWATTSGNAATRAFQLQNGGVLMSLGTLGGTNSAATAIGDGIVGWSQTAGNASTHAFLVTGGTMHDIGTLGGTSEALGVNAESVVGRSTVSSGAMHGFLYSGGVMMDAGTLGGVNSQTNAINLVAQAVGTSELSGTRATHGFIYDHGVMTDVNALLQAGSGWVLETATGINTWGDIVGTGLHAGARHGYRLSPAATLTLFSGGSLSQSDSNVPHGGVQVGRDVEFVTSIITDGPNAYDVELTDTMSGPVEIVGAFTYQGNPCSVGGNKATCRMPLLGPGSAFEDEVHVVVNVTGPGAFSHTAHVTAANVVPISAHTVSEQNIGIALESFTLSASTAAGGTPVQGRAQLTSLAPPGGAVVKLASSNPAIAPVPSTFVVQVPTAFRTFNIIPAVVSQPTPVTISATYGHVTISRAFTVVPPALKTVSLTRSTMIGSCQTATAKVTLTGSAPTGGAGVALVATATGAHVPATIAVAAGATTASVTVTSDAVHALMNGVLRASYGGVTEERPLAVRPIFIISVILTPSTVIGGTNANGVATIECAAPTGGVLATLVSTNATAATPASGALTIAAGARSGAFVVNTKPVASPTLLSIRATANGVTRSATLQVNPSQP
jgi:probable HAF family extracellular repeat protein